MTLEHFKKQLTPLEYSQFIYNFSSIVSERHCRVDNYLDLIHKCSTLHTIISYSFSWWSAPEGEVYWKNISIRTEIPKTKELYKIY